MLQHTKCSWDTAEQVQRKHNESSGRKRLPRLPARRAGQRGAPPVLPLQAARHRLLLPLQRLLPTLSPAGQPPDRPARPAAAAPPHAPPPPLCPAAAERRWPPPAPLGAAGSLASIASSCDRSACRGGPWGGPAGPRGSRAPLTGCARRRRHSGRNWMRDQDSMRRSIDPCRTWEA